MSTWPHHSPKMCFHDLFYTLVIVESPWSETYFWLKSKILPILLSSPFLIFMYDWGGGLLFPELCPYCWISKSVVQIKLADDIRRKKKLTLLYWRDATLHFKLALQEPCKDFLCLIVGIGFLPQDSTRSAQCIHEVSSQQPPWHVVVFITY